jgi:hypothetical protein
LGGLWLKANPGKKFVRPISTIKKLGMVVCACHPSYSGSIKRKMELHLPIQKITKA